MEKQELERRGLTPTWSLTPPDDVPAQARERPSDLRDASDLLEKQADVARRAADYADANAGDFEEE
jgi:hypothetical protein